MSYIQFYKKDLETVDRECREKREEKKTMKKTMVTTANLTRDDSDAKRRTGLLHWLVRIFHNM